MKSVVSDNILKNKSLYIRGLLLGAIISCLVITVLLIITSFVLTQTGNVPTDILNIIIYVLDGIGVFCGSYIALRIIKAGGLAWGIISGFVLFLIIFIAGLISSTETLSASTFFKLLISVICGALGGIIGVNKKKKVKYE